MTVTTNHVKFGTS